MNNKKIMAVGHLCVDMHPKMSADTDFKEMISPGKIVNVAAPTFCPGGVVGNTGIGLYRLQRNVEVVGIIGDDLLGRVTLEILQRISPKLSKGIIVKKDETTSYSIVLEAPGFDRCILHCPGANDTFAVADLDLSRVDGVDIFHFGYPPIMREFYKNGGANMRDMFAEVKERGAMTSLDMSLPDPASEGGKLDWVEILENTLPYVDVFLPSIDEICFMLKVDLPESMAELKAIAERLIDMGVAVVGIKQGTNGMYMRSSADKGRIASCSNVLADVDAWVGAEGIAPCRKTTVVSTKGAGDSTIAGFLAGMLEGFGPQKALECAIAVGACCVENEDATEGITGWEQIVQRMAQSEERLEVDLIDN